MIGEALFITASSIARGDIMNKQTVTYEQTLVAVARTLPPDRAAELLDFARFLQALVAQSTVTTVTQKLPYELPKATFVPLNLKERLQECIETSWEAGCAGSSQTN
jgi:hypothetical protein